jgi:hypothetical protein
VRYVCGTNLLFIFKNKENKGEQVMGMDLKKMLMDMAEAQAEKMKEEMVNHLASDEMTDTIATRINEKIDIPFVSEEKEQIFFEKCVDVVSDILEGMFRK